MNCYTFYYSVFTEYMNCSEPFMDSCSEETRIEIQTLSLSLGLICGDLLEGN